MRPLIAAVCLLAHPVLALAALVGMWTGADPLWLVRLLTGAVLAVWVLLFTLATDPDMRTARDRADGVHTCRQERR